MAFFGWLNSWQRRLAVKPRTPVKTRRNRLRLEVLEDRNLLSSSSTVNLLVPTGFVGPWAHLLGSELGNPTQIHDGGSVAKAHTRSLLGPVSSGSTHPVSPAPTASSGSTTGTIGSTGTGTGSSGLPGSHGGTGTSGGTAGTGTGTSGGTGTAGTTSHGISTGPIDISKQTGNETEEVIAVDPANPKLEFACSNQDTELTGLFATRSTDGGKTWQTRFMADGSDSLPQACCDPSAFFDSFGNLFVSYLDSSVSSAVLTVSTDGGATFKKIASFAAQDQPKLAVGAGSVWYVWNNGADLDAAGAPVTGLGAIGTFTPVLKVPNVPVAAPNFGKIAISPTGKVVLTFQDALSASGPDNIFMSINSAGLGGTFSTPTLITSTNVGGFDPITPQEIRTVDAESEPFYDNSPGPHHGRLYLVYTDATAPQSSKMAILVRTSDNDGASWSAPVMVNGDGMTSAKFFPRIRVDPINGDVGVGWYDARNISTNDQVEEFVGFSFDGGKTFNNIQVATAPSSAIVNINNGNQFGDYSGLDFFNGILYPIWCDNSSTLVGNPDPPNFDLATAQVQSNLIPPPDQFETGTGGDTSDTASNMGTIIGDQQFTNLSIANQPNGLPDYDWFRWTAGKSGTFTSTLAIQAEQGGLEIHLFTLKGNTLVELASNTSATFTKTVTATVTAGQTMFVEVKGINYAPGLMGVGIYNLDVNLV